VRYFSGFSLHGEEELFGEFLDNSDFTVAGFSYGAQQAFEYAYASSERVERLILLSPAFFQLQKPAFRRAQLRYFQADPESYTTQFLANVAYPSDTALDKYLHIGTYEELAALLEYEWSVERFEELKERGVKIEVYLGGKDRIVDAQAAFGFFSELALSYLIKDVGHLLR